MNKKLVANFSDYDLIKIQSGDTFIEWTQNEFLKHCKWIKEDIKNKLELKQQRVQIKKALEIALCDLTLSNNLLATDRPDLVTFDAETMWTTNNSEGINAINKVLSLFGEGE